MFDCGIALALPQHVESHARRTATRMQEGGISFEFALTHEFVPHITLYQGRFAREELANRAWSEVKKEYRKRQFILPTITLSGVPNIRANRNVFWVAENSIPLLIFHERIALGMNSCTNGLLLPEARSALRNGTTTERIRIMRFGMLATGGQYCPHVTIGRLASSNDAVRARGYPPPKCVFVPRGLLYGPIDEFGRMKEPKFIECN